MGFPSIGLRAIGLRAIGLATLVALAGASALPAPIMAADPSPAASPSPSLAPTDPVAVPLPVPTPEPGSTSLTAVSSVASPPPAATTTTRLPAKLSVAARVVGIATAQRGKRYVLGASGPQAFDCSGLVRYAYLRAGVTRLLGGGHSARGMYLWARLHRLADRSRPRVGDVVIYGGGAHAAIYIGNGRVISALNPRQGIRITGVYALRTGFTAFIHTGL